MVALNFKINDKCKQKITQIAYISILFVYYITKKTSKTVLYVIEEMPENNFYLLTCINKYERQKYIITSL